MKSGLCLILAATVLHTVAAFENIAPHGHATATDSWDQWTGPDKAIDGNRHRTWIPWSHSNSVYVSRSTGPNVFLKVEFDTPVYVDSIQIWSRQDYSPRIQGMTVYVDDKLVKTMVDENRQVYEIPGIKMTGRSVILRAQPRGIYPNDGYLNIAELEIYGAPQDIVCVDSSGKEWQGGESYENEQGKTCACGFNGMVCRCEGEDIACAAGTYKWTDQDTCLSKCIKNDGFCASSGDPHYVTFDKKYYDFHGVCTYQAASCEDFAVFLKNVDLRGGPPRYTLRMELRFKGQIFAIANRYQATVDGNTVQLPYVKQYTNGDSVTIANYGQLEIVLQQPSKGRSPAVKLVATNANSYINAQITLHGSCSGISEGICGNWNDNPNDDLIGGSPNTLGTKFQVYDENCPAPPRPYHPCDDVENGYEQAAAICDDIKGAPFNSCHSRISIGNEDGGIYKNCMTDVCNCFIDKSCACSQYDNYADSCIAAGVDLSNWRESVEYCPYECPEGLTYMAAGPVPSPTCLNKEPEGEETARGCFCPNGQYLQDGVCVSADQCKCLYEGVFYNTGDSIKKDSECKECTCEDGGDMTCASFKCPALSCAEGEISAMRDDQCCPYCESDWVNALNPEEKAKAGQDIVLTCQVNADVAKDDIVWLKDGAELSEGLSKDRLKLKLSDVEVEDSGVYVCQATKGDATSSADFQVTVPEPEDKITIKPAKSTVKCKATKGCNIQFKISKESGEKVSAGDVQLCQVVDGKRVNCKADFKEKKGKFKTKVGSKKATDPSLAGEWVLVVTDGGKETVSDPVTVTVKQ